MKRRALLTALGTASVASLAGCIGDDENGDANGDDGTPTDEDGEPANGDDGAANGDDGTPTDEGTENGDGEQPSSDLGDPTAPIEAFVDAAEASDTDAAVALLHPSHPFHPDNLEDDEWEFELSGSDAPIERLETAVLSEDPAPADVIGRVAGAEFFFEEDALADALNDGPAALVEARMVPETGDPATLLGVVTAHDGEWRLLWQGEPAQQEAAAPEFEARVVEEIQFDTDEHQARVQFVDSPVADSVTVESTGPTDADGVVVTENTSDTPASVDYLDVSVDPEGDEVVVTATVDGEARVVHRERYPPDERLVDEISFDTDVEEDDPFGARARIELNDVEREGELRITSTRADGEISTDTTDSITFLTVGFDADGDEIVVTLTQDGETEEIHRERFHP